MLLLLRQFKFKQFKKIIGIFFLLFLNSCYEFKLAYQQMRLFSLRQDIATYASLDSVSDDTKEKIRLLKKILTFAKKEKLKVEKAYEKIISNTDEAVSYLVQVAPKDKLELVTWWYPFVGSVPYKGYFSKEARNAESKKWLARGYDIYETKAEAFSSLGWFEDPIYLSMLENDEAFLADTIFHELVHRTIWIKGSVEFNEQLASYLASQMVQKYLLEENKLDMLESYRTYLLDKKYFKKWLSELTQKLETNYSDNEYNPKNLLDQKRAIFTEFLTTKKPDFKRFDFVSDPKKWNNAKVLASSLYSPDENLFWQAYACYFRLPAGDFLRILEKQIIHTQDYKKALETICKKQ